MSSFCLVGGCTTCDQWISFRKSDREKIDLIIEFLKVLGNNTTIARPKIELQTNFFLEIQPLLEKVKNFKEDKTDKMEEENKSE